MSNNKNIFKKHFESGMIVMNFNAFQRTHSTLLKCILSAMKEVEETKQPTIPVDDEVKTWEDKVDGMINYSKVLASDLVDSWTNYYLISIGGEITIVTGKTIAEAMDKALLISDECVLSYPNKIKLIK